MISYDIDTIISRLHDDAGMKIDRDLFLDQRAILAEIAKRKSLFQQITLESQLGSTMLYGHNQEGHYFKIGFSGDLINRIIISTRKVLSKRFAMVIEYDGTGFFGFQSQSKQRSVQSEIEKVVSEINEGKTACLGASRTDTGVHARFQVVHFDSMRSFSAEKWMYVLNRKLPEDIHVHAIELVHPLFHSRYDVSKKEYRYVLNQGEYSPLRRNYEWTVEKLDLDILEKNLAQLVGTHDFTSFCTGEKEEKNRTIYEARLESNATKVELIFVGNGFLHHMIRLIVWQLVAISQHQSKQDIATLIAEKSRKNTTRMAPAQGLYLTKVEY